MSQGCALRFKKDVCHSQELPAPVCGSRCELSAVPGTPHPHPPHHTPCPPSAMMVCDPLEAQAPLDLSCREHGVLPQIEK